VTWRNGHKKHKKAQQKALSMTHSKNEQRPEFALHGEALCHGRAFRLSLLCFFVFFVAKPARGFDEVIDSPMYKAPDTPGPRFVLVFPEKAKDLWVKVLERPEAELRCRAAEAIVRAHGRGVKGLETTIGPLRAALDQPDQHPAVRLAVARALIVLEAQVAAPSLFRLARSGGVELRNVVEPALARWDYRPARAVWLERLRDPETPSWSLVLAVRGLAMVGEQQAADRLREIVLSDTRPGPLRLEAARALGTIHTAGLEKDAERLAADASSRGTVSRLAAAALLRRHKGERAVELLQRFTRDREPSVAAVALVRLIEIDPKLVVPALEHVLASPDANVRSLGVDVLLRQPTEQHLRLMGDRLDDAHPDVRGKARRALYELAEKKELRSRIIEEGMRVLRRGRAQWRGLEQATILLTQLGHKPAAGRLVELLSSDRPEVFITAAWGLRKLAVKDTLSGVVAYAKVAKKRLAGMTDLKSEPLSNALDHQLSQLNQFLGQQKYAPADGILREFIPRPGMSQPGVPEARAAAIWALGLIHEGKSDAKLVGALEGRLNSNEIPPEYPQVRRMSAITLARLKAKEALPSLRRHFRDGKPSENPVNNACGWAIEQLTGEVMPAPETKRGMQRDWFLTPDK
jgi:HEAT repeat protein